MCEKSIKVTSFFNTLRTFMSVLFPLITFPYASRVLGPVGIGKVNFSSSIVSYFVMLAMLGVNNYGMREAGKYRDEKELLSKFVKEVLIINLTACLFAYTMLFLSVFFLPALYEYRILLIISSVSILFSVIGLDWLFYALEDLGSVALRTFIFQILSLTLLFVFVKTSDDYIKYAGIAVISSVGTNIVSLLFARRYVDFKFQVKLDIKKHLKPVFVFFMMAIATTVNSSIDTTMLGFISGVEQVGYYSAALKVIRLVVAVVTSMTVILPRLSFYCSNGEIEKFKILSTKTLNANIVLALPASVGIFLVSDNIIVLLSGKMYTSSVPVLQILSGTIIFLALANLSGSHILLSLGKEKISFYAVLIGILFNIITNLILIPDYGALGAGFATLISEFSVALIEYFFVWKFFIYKDVIKNLFQSFFASFLMAISVKFILKINLSITLTLLFSIFTGCLVYFLILFVLKNKALYSLITTKKGSTSEK